MSKYVNCYSIMSFLLFPYFLTLMMLETLFYDSVNNTYNYMQMLFFAFSFVIVLIFLYIRDVKKHEVILYIVYYLSSIFAISSESLLSMVIAFEVMALSAIVILAIQSYGVNQKSVLHYSCIHFLAGVLLLIGASCEMLSLNIGHYCSNFCKLFFLVGILINCACFPLSSWVPDAYSSASNNGIIVLSIFTTKVSAYILLHFFQGEKILLFLGIATSIYGIIFSILENNIKRLLCYNLVGQMGLVITAIGFSYSNGTELNGIIILQIILSIAYQTLLFMVAISIINSTQKFNLNEIGGLFSKMPIEAICAAIAILNMGAFPGTGGFVSKFLISHNLDNTDIVNVLVSKLFLFCSISLFISVGLKFFWFAFLSRSVKTSIVKSIGFCSRISLLMLTAVLIYFGVLGSYSIFYRFSNDVFHSMILQYSVIFVSILFFLFCRSIFKGRINFSMDIDCVYRVLFVYIMELGRDFLLYIHNIFVRILSMSRLFYCRTEERIIDILSASSLGLTIISAMLFIVIMVVVYLCLSL